MDKTIILQLVKERLGIRSNVRDTYLGAIVDGVISELEDVQGLVLDSANPHYLIFIVDYVSWRYENAGKQEGMPRHLQFRLNNLVIKKAGTVV